MGYAAAAAGVAAVTALISLLPGAADVRTIPMLYLLVVVGAAFCFGSRPAVVASILAFLAFDLFFVSPPFRITVRRPSEWLALGMFLFTAAMTGHLTSLLQARAQEARQRAREAAALAEAISAVAAQVNCEAALQEVLRQLADVVEVESAAIVVRSERDDYRLLTWHAPRRESLPDFTDRPFRSAIDFTLEHGQAIAWQAGGWKREKGPGADAQAAASYLPLIIEQRVLGVLYLRLRDRHGITQEERRAVESLARQTAVVLERDRLARTEARAQALAEADRLKTALLSMVSHNFRSPLASIKASVTGLLQDGRPWDAATQRELLRGIDQEGDRLNRMVGNILALSRLEADAWRPESESIPLAEVVEAAVDSFSPNLRRRIRAEMDPDLDDVWLDPVQIVEVLHNLLDNALKYSPPHTEVELRGSRQEDALQLEVLDRGMGLSPGEAERIFERFYRKPRLQESASPGLGIGLTVCRGLIEAHGGRLEASNREGGGAAFRVILPRALPGGCGGGKRQHDEGSGH